MVWTGWDVQDRGSKRGKIGGRVEGWGGQGQDSYHPTCAEQLHVMHNEKLGVRTRYVRRPSD